MDSQFLGAVLLKDIHPDAESPGELSPDETVACDEEVDEICDLIRSLGNEVSEDGLRRFFAFAHAIDLPPWQAAMAELEELRPGAGWTGRITEALRLCRQEPPAGASLALLKKLRRIF